MTVLQALINEYEGIKDFNIDVNLVIQDLKDLLPEEEQQIRDAFKAGQEYESYNESSEYGIKEPPTDIKSYITNLKK